MTEPGKTARATTYTMNLEEDTSADIHVGANIPLVSGSSGLGASPRQDVGLALRCHLARMGDDLLLHTVTELSAPEDVDQGPRAIRKISMNGDALVAPGKTAVVSSVQEPTSGARYEVTVAATKLR
jgi:hypothetical protein